MQIPTIMLSTVLALNGPAPAAPSNTAVVENCPIVVIKEAKVSPQEAGILRESYVEEGDKIYGIAVSRSVENSLWRFYPLAILKRRLDEQLVAALHDALIQDRVDPQQVTKTIKQMRAAHGEKEVSLKTLLDDLKTHSIAVSPSVENSLRRFYPPAILKRRLDEQLVGALGEALAQARVDPQQITKTIEQMRVAHGEEEVSLRTILGDVEMSLRIVLAKLGDTRAQMEHVAAKHRLEVAIAKAENDTKVLYATAARDVARAEWKMNKMADLDVPGSVTQMELQRLLLTYHRTVWEIEQAKVDQKIAGLEANVARSQLDAAEDLLDRHRIKSPLTGEVIKRFHHEGEWVQPNITNGDPVFHVVRLDRVRVEGILSFADVKPALIGANKVRIEVTDAFGRPNSFEGTVSFVSPMDQSNGRYQVWAEVDNQLVNGRWLLRPGMLAKMVIELPGQGR